jgi:O-antigen/teichoic acid export membrane protein
MSLRFQEVITVLPYSLGNYLSNLLEQNTQTFILLMILKILGPNSSGHITIAWLVGSIVTSIGFAWAGSAFAESSNNIAKTKIIFIKASLPALVVTLSLALVIGYGAPLWLSFFGDSYAIEASGYLRVLMIASPFTIITFFYLTYLRVINKVRLLLLVDILQVCFIVAFTRLFLQKFGIIVVSVVSGISYSIIALPIIVIALLFYIRQRRITS